MCSRELTIIHSEHARIFFQTRIQPKIYLDKMTFELLVGMFSKRCNTPEGNLRLMDEWNAINFKEIGSLLPNTSLQAKTD